MKQLDNSTLRIIKTRSFNSHKGNYGKVLIIAGSHNFGGAAIMCSSAAIYAGAGLVTLATDPSLFTAINIATPEVMTIDYNTSLIHNIRQADIIAVGPGLDIPDRLHFFKILIDNMSAYQTLIIDASALNTLAENINILDNCEAQVILTPHQMEWERLSKIKIKDQTPEKNLEFINGLNSSPTVIIKGHQTHIFNNGNIYQNISGNPGMATGGSGDTLTGILAAFCAQFGTNIETINAAVYTHSDIANKLYESNYVILPEKLIQRLPEYMKKAAH